MAMKTCNRCLRSKDGSQFTPNPQTADGTDPTCHPCRAILRAAYRVGGLAQYREAVERRIEDASAVVGARSLRIEKLRDRIREIEYLEECMKEVRA